MQTEMTVAPRREGARKAAPGATASARLVRAWLPALSLGLVLVAIAYLNPRAISYFRLSLMLNLAIPSVLATIVQMFVIKGNELDLSIGPFVGFVGCVTATWLNDAPWLGVAALVGAIGVYAALGALIYLRNLPSIVVTLGMSFVWQGLAILMLPQRGGSGHRGDRPFRADAHVVWRDPARVRWQSHGAGARRVVVAQDQGRSFCA